MTRSLAHALAVCRRDLALQRTYGLSLAIGVASSSFALLSHHFVSRWVGLPPTPGLGAIGYFAFVSSGLVLQLVITAALAALGGALAREAFDGTLETTLAAGASPGALLLGSALVPCALALAQATLVLALGAAFAGLPLGNANAAAALAWIAATLLACAPLGVVGAAAWLLVKRPGLVTTLAAFVFALLGGVYFPVDVLPAPLARVADAIPLTLGVHGFRAALLNGAGLAQHLGTFTGLLAEAAIGLPIAALLFRSALERARRRGALASV